MSRLVRLVTLAIALIVVEPAIGGMSTNNNISKFYGVWSAEDNCATANEQSEGVYFNLDKDYYEHGFGTRCTEVTMWLDGRNLRVSATCQGEEQGLQVKAFEIEHIDHDHVKIGNQVFHRCRERGERTNFVKFQIVNNTQGAVHLGFFENNYKIQFAPGPGEVYILEGNSTKTYEINCIGGQNICYGATIPGSSLQLFWGVGRDGRQSCSGCCLACPRADPLTKTLNTSDSRRPN